jgi:hypothetical protein
MHTNITMYFKFALLRAVSRKNGFFIIRPQ